MGLRVNVEVNVDLGDIDTDDLITELRNRGKKNIIETALNSQFDTQIEVDALNYCLEVLNKYTLQQIEQALPV